VSTCRAKSVALASATFPTDRTATCDPFVKKVGTHMGQRPKRSLRTSRRPTPAKAQRRASKVMIADDRRLVGEALAGINSAARPLAIALVTSDAIDLLEAAQRDPPALAVIDAAMAESFWVMRSLTMRCPRTKVILLDELANDVHLRQARDCGAAGVSDEMRRSCGFCRRRGPRPGWWAGVPVTDFVAPGVGHEHLSPVGSERSRSNARAADSAGA
jgi:hypothetical protein